MSSSVFDARRVHDQARLVESITRARRKLLPFREKRLEHLKTYCGRHYAEGQGAAKNREPLNMLGLAAKVYAHQLAAESPAALVLSDVASLRSLAAAFELAINQHLRQIELEETLGLAVLESFFSLGIVKVFLDEEGRPAAHVVSLDNWVHDTSAPSLRQGAFCGDRRRIALSRLRHDADLFGFDERVVRRLEPTRLAAIDESGGERDQTLADESPDEDEELLEGVWLWDVYVPGPHGKRQVVTLACDDTGSPHASLPPLRVDRWTGPDRGPYSHLFYFPVPGNAVPSPPANDLKDLHDLENGIYRKLHNQSNRSKVVLAVKRGFEQDGRTIADAVDGSQVQVDDPESVRPIVIPGIDQANLAFGMHVDERFNRQAGNLDLLAGLAAQSETASQDKLLAANASTAIQRMQHRMTVFTRSVIEGLAFWLWDDPDYDPRLVQEVPGGVRIPFDFSPAAREQSGGKFSDFRFDIVPYSMQPKAPAGRLQTINEIMQGLVLPALPLLKEQGIELNLEALLKIVGRYAQLPELDEILVYTSEQEPSAANRPSGQGQGEPPRQSPVTTRRNIREQRPASSRQARDQQMLQTLLSGAANNNPNG